MFLRRSKNTSRRSGSRWYELPLFIAVASATVALFGQFIITILPIMSADTGDFYISIEPMPIEAELIPNELIPESMENWSHIEKESQMPHAIVNVQDLNWILKDYRYPIFLKSDDNYNRLHNLVIRFRTPTIEPPFTAEIFVYTTNATQSIDNLPITIEGVGGDGKRRNCTIYIFYHSPEDLVRDGLIQAVSGNYTSSIELFNKSIEIDPNYALAWKNKGIVLARYLGEDMKALSCINRSLILDSTDEEAWCIKGIILLRLTYFNDSLECFTNSIKLKSEYPLAWTAKGDALMKKNNLDGAIIAYNEAIRIDPNYATAWLNKGLALKKKGKSA